MADAKKLIEPRTLSGFRDYLPDAMMPRERLIDTAKRVYRSYGFSPIDTPALEHLEILTGKGSEETDRQMYHFVDNGKRPVGMRFDLTVPLARFIAQHVGVLGTPFKRYHIATVWRGESPQDGRYREFMQCDFDTIGTRSLAADVETALVIHDLMRAIGFEKFAIRVNNRQVLNGLLERLNLLDKSTSILRSLDKLRKIGPEKVIAEMAEHAGASAAQAQQVLDFAALEGTSEEVLAKLKPLVAGSQRGEEGVARLHDLFAAAQMGGVNPDKLVLDVSIARGLDYYTGVIFETFLDDLPTIGSVCSGGRYDNLAAMYSKQELPGIGASLGLDRLLTAMQKLGLVEKVSTPAAVFVPYFEATRLHDYLKLAQRIRALGVGVEVYPDPIRLGQQLKYADRRGFKIALVAGSNELTAGTVQVKDLATGGISEVSLGTAGALEEAVRKLLG